MHTLLRDDENACNGVTGHLPPKTTIADICPLVKVRVRVIWLVFTVSVKVIMSSVHRGALSNAASCPSVCLSDALAQNDAFYGYG